MLFGFPCLGTGFLCMQVCSQLRNDTGCNMDMNTKSRPSRIVYRYVEDPQPIPVGPPEESKPQPPKESVAYRVWTNCYQPPTVHFDLPSPISSASTSSNSSTSPYRSGSTSSLHSSDRSTFVHGFVTKPSPPATRPPPPISRAHPYSLPAALTKPKTIQTESSPLLSRSSTRPLETSYITTTTTITTKDGTVVEKHKVVSTHGFHDGKDAVDWSAFRSPDWGYPLHKKVKGKKVFASYSHCRIK